MGDLNSYVGNTRYRGAHAIYVSRKEKFSVGSLSRTVAENRDDSWPSIVMGLRNDSRVTSTTAQWVTCMRTWPGDIHRRAER